MQRARDAWVLVVMVLVVALGAAYQERSREAVESFRTSEDPGPDGHKALYLLCKQRGIPVARIHDPLLAMARASAVILVEPFRRTFERQERDRLLAWVRSGGLVVYVPVLTGSQRRAQPGDPMQAVRPVPSFNSALGKASVVAYRRDVPYLATIGEEVLEKRQPGRWRTIAGQGKKLFGIEQALGAGRWITLSTSIWPSNELLGQVPNATFVLNILESAMPGRGQVWFDEYHHSLPSEAGTSMNLWTAIGAPGRLATWAVGVLLLALVYNGNRRLGRPLEAVSHKPRGVSDHLRAMALLYRRARAGEVALRAPFSRVVAAAADHVGLSRGASVEVIAAALAKARPGTDVELRAIATALGAAGKSTRLADREAVDLMQRMDALVEALSD